MILIGTVLRRTLTRYISTGLTSKDKSETARHIVVKVLSNNFYSCLQRVTNFVIGIMKLDVIYSSLAQSVEQRAVNSLVVSSNLSGGAITFVSVVKNLLIQIIL